MKSCANCEYFDGNIYCKHKDMQSKTCYGNYIPFEVGSKKHTFSCSFYAPKELQEEQDVIYTLKVKELQKISAEADFSQSPYLNPEIQVEAELRLQRELVLKLAEELINNKAIKIHKITREPHTLTQEKVIKYRAQILVANTEDILEIKRGE